MSKIGTQFIELAIVKLQRLILALLALYPSWFYSNINSICAEQNERCSVNRVQQTQIYKSRQLSWSVWHHPNGCVHGASSLFPQESEDAATLPIFTSHVNVLLDIDLILN